MIITERLKILRIKNNLKQEEVAKILNVTKQAYGRYENGERELGPRAIVTLAEFYKVSSDYLLGITDDPAKK